MGRAQLFRSWCWNGTVGGRTAPSAMGWETGSCLGKEGSGEDQWGLKTGQQPQTHTHKKFREEERMMWILILFCFVAGCAMNAILSVLLVGFMPTMTLNTP